LRHGNRGYRPNPGDTGERFLKEWQDDMADREKATGKTATATTAKRKKASVKKTAASKTAQKAPAKKAATKKTPRKTAVKKAAPGKAAAKKATAKRKAAARKRKTPRHISHEQRWRMVAEAAYHRAEQRYFSPGGEVEDWLAAEAEVDARLAADGILVRG
jgi:hypothetical protein